METTVTKKRDRFYEARRQKWVEKNHAVVEYLMDHPEIVEELEKSVKVKYL